MEKFQRILFVSQGLTDETNALKQALSLVRNNAAELGVLLVCPELPKEMRGHVEAYERALVDRVKASFRSACRELAVSSGDEPSGGAGDGGDARVVQYGTAAVAIGVERGSEPAVRIIRQVLQGGYDLVVKAAEPKNGGQGFRAVDMDLLRKCPCAVFLSRPINRHRGEMQVAVAVDPESAAVEGQELSGRLLEVARAYADTCSGELHVVGCWDYPVESSLRHNPWIAVTQEEVDGFVRAASHRSHGALTQLMEEAKISGKINVHHVRGSPDKAIPECLEKHGIDVLVMGTVGRTGIPGFIIGNTAENIVQRLGCSLLALKPRGFASPVRAA